MSCAFPGEGRCEPSAAKNAPKHWTSPRRSRSTRQSESPSPASAWVRPVGPPRAERDRLWHVLRWLIIAGIAWGIWRPADTAAVDLAEGPGDYAVGDRRATVRQAGRRLEAAMTVGVRPSQVGRALPRRLCAPSVSGAESAVGPSGRNWTAPGDLGRWRGTGGNLQQRCRDEPGETEWSDVGSVLGDWPCRSGAGYSDRVPARGGSLGPHRLRRTTARRTGAVVQLLSSAAPAWNAR